MKKLEILQNEELRNKEINSLKNQIQNIDKETKLLEEDELNIDLK